MRKKAVKCQKFSFCKEWRFSSNPQKHLVGLFVPLVFARNSETYVQLRHSSAGRKFLRFWPLWSKFSFFISITSNLVPAGGDHHEDIPTLSARIEEKQKRVDTRYHHQKLLNTWTQLPGADRGETKSPI